LISKFFIKLLIIVVPIGTLVALCNYFIDPANLFSADRYVSGVAGILGKGNNADNVFNYDERLLQEKMIQHLNTTPDIIIMGSSRVMEIDNSFFPGQKVLNVGVSHANIYDIIAITGLLDSMNRVPQNIYLNVDPGLISKKATEEWQSLDFYYRRYITKNDPLRLIDIPTNLKNQKKISSLFSLQYLKESLSFLFKGLDKEIIDVGKNMPVIGGRLSDGSVCYSNEYKNPDTALMRVTALETARKEKLSEKDPEKIELLNGLLDFYARRNTKVHFILLPFHPAYYETINAHQQNLFKDYEKLYRTIASERNIAVTGTFDPGFYPIPQVQFYDMYHCSKKAIQTIFSK
jgi:hypothetical protein